MNNKGKTAMTMQLQYQLSNGDWVDCGDRTEEFLDLCVKFGGHGDRDATVAALMSGKIVRNDCNDWYSECREYSVSADSRRAAQQAEEAQIKAELLTLPVSGTTKLLTLLSWRVVVGHTRASIKNRKIHVATAILNKERITDDHPSCCGSHLLGHEGEMGVWVEYEIRG